MAGLCLALSIGVAARAWSQAYSPLQAPDSARVAAVRSLGDRYETVWNVLLLDLVRARLAHDARAESLGRLATSVARAESSATGGHIGRDALARLARWTPAEQTLRLQAGFADSLALKARQEGAFASADSLYRDAIGGYQRLGERRALAVALGGLGAALLGAGDYPRADSVIRLALEARRVIGDQRLEANSLSDLGLALFHQDSLEAAAACHAAAAAIRARLGLRGPLARTRAYLAATLHALGRTDSALVEIHAALTLADSVGALAVVSTVLSTYGYLLDQCQCVPGDETIEIERRAMAAADQVGNLQEATNARRYLGSALRRRGLYAEALEVLENLQAQAANAGLLDQEAFALIEAGRTWSVVPEPDSARSALLRALALADSLNSPGIRWRALNNLAIAERRAERAAEARSHARLGLGIASDAGDSLGVHDLAITLGQLTYDDHDRAGSAGWFQRAAGALPQAGDEQRTADRINLGWASFFAGDGSGAAALFDSSLAAARRLGAGELVWPALEGLGEVAEGRGDWSGALDSYRMAAGVVDTLRAEQGRSGGAVAFLGGRMVVFESLVHLLTGMARGRPGRGYAEEAFTWAERSRARALLDLMEANGAAHGRPPAITLPQVQAKLSGDEALLYFSLGDSSSTVWIVRPGGSWFERLPPRPAIALHVTGLRLALADPTAARGDLALRESRWLYRTLIGVADRRLRGISRLRIAPDGPLWTIPFEALRASVEAGPDGRRPGGYAVERWEISYLPSAALLFETVRRVPVLSVLALADPRFNGRGQADARSAPDSALLPRLPGTRQELEALRQAVGTANCHTLTDSAATRDGLLADPWLDRAVVVHLGTHGDVSARPEDAGLWLAADSTGRPSRLSVADVLRLRLNAELVTLSACGTGLGTLAPGEGVLGLARAFLAAGAGAVAVSLWDVSDQRTAQLMGLFYRGLLGQGRTRSTALAEAKRAMIGDPHSSPYFWAPFVLIGDPGPLGFPGRAGSHGRAAPRRSR